MQIEQMLRLMEEHDVARHSDLVGVSPREIRQLEQRFGLEFPAAYQQFLLTCGRSAGYLSTWMAIYFDDLLEIREEFERITAEHFPDITLPPEALLIAHWDCRFDWIICDGSDDPPVYRMDLQLDSGAYCQACASTFSAYIEALIRNNEAEKGLPEALSANEEFGARWDSEDDRLLPHR
jgi:hypothetical protein